VFKPNVEENINMWQSLLLLGRDQCTSSNIT